MKPRQLAFLTAVVAALAAAVAVQNMSHEAATSRSDTTSVLDVNVVVDEINRVTVSQGDDSTRVVVERLPDRWVTRSAWDHPADERKVRELIEAMNGLRGEFRSDDAGVLADYGLGPDAEPRPVTVTLYGADWQEVASLELGATAANGGAFVREPDSDAAYLTRTSVLGKLGMWGGPATPEARTFLDLDVFECQARDIRTITLFTDSTTLRMEKTFAGPDSTGAVDHGTWEWLLTEPERRPLAKTKVDAVMNALTKVQAADIADPKGDWQAYGLWKAPRRVEVGLADGGMFELRWGVARDVSAGQQSGLYVMSSKDQTVWVIREFKANQIFKALDDLLPES